MIKIHGAHHSLSAQLTRCLCQVMQKVITSILFHPKYIKLLVSCTVTDSCSENEDKPFLPAAVTVSLE